MFFTDYEKEISNEYLKNGYIIRPADDMNALHEIKREFISTISDILGDRSLADPENLLNNIHTHISPSELNSFRMEIIQSINSRKDFRE